MDPKEIVKIRTRDAATAGVVLGVVLYLVVLIDYFAQISLTAGYVLNLANIAILSILLYYYACRYGRKIGVESLSFGQSYGFIILVMLFTGLIYGSLYFIQTNIIDPGYYTEIQTKIITENTQLTNDQKDQALSILSQALSDPFTVIISAMFSTIFTGSFLGLIVSVFVKNKKNNLDVSDQEVI